VKGDFSKVHFAPQDNFDGILPQQGKVLLDSDGIAQTLIENNWHETAARDWVGNVAGVPAALSNSFDISAASLAGGIVTLTVGTGHLWADGLLVRLEDESSVTVQRTATWLEPPLVFAEGSSSDVADGTTDAVVLEVWQHAINGYQIPDVLIEPALGGPDTAERLQTSFAFRLARLAAGQTCADLTFDESNRGALTVSLVPPIVTTGDCPVEGSGGYSGFEHQLYRVEIADPNAGPSQFKWSRTNGGLVGRGAFDPATQSIAITANLPAINSANQSSFYLEIEGYDTDLGYSRALAGVQATFSSSTLQCAATPNFGSYPFVSGSIFFRLWDGISPVSSYPISATPVQLENGILLQFDPDGTGKYLPGDYWMFPVRAQGIPNPQVLINARTPQGIVYHRVPLAEITWASAGGGAFSAAPIEDCRTIVPPLSRTKGCCTCRVGDGVESFGDFTSIQLAIDSLPAEGGEVCLLPGRYYEHVRIINRRDIVIHGCGWQTRVASPSLAPIIIGLAPHDGAAASGAINPIAAVITIIGSQHIELRAFAVEAADDEAGILVDGIGTSLAPDPTIQRERAAVSLRATIDVTIEDMVLTAATLPAILAQRVELLRIDRNRVAMKNILSTWPAIYTSGKEIHIDGNWVGIQSIANDLEWLPITVTTDISASAVAAPPAPAATAAPVPSPSATAVLGGIEFIDASTLGLSVVNIAIHPGGIQIGGPSTDVYVLENEIEGGSRNGITLGSFDVLDANGDSTGIWTGVTVSGEGEDCCTGTLQPPPVNPGSNGGTIVASGILNNIQIHRNRIRNMGLCGIGPVGFFNLLETLEVITILGLNISQNEISRTVLRSPAAIDQSKSSIFGYGAISVPDVLSLTICDNAVTIFGPQPGVGACGIFVLHGEMLEISRNQILETRDWNNTSAVEQDASTGAHGGIVILLATPPTFGQPIDPSQWSSDPLQANPITAPVYEPGLPALRIEHNVVRVPLGYALEIIGLGPFTIANNQFTSGGMVRTTAARALAQTVLIANLGTPIDGSLKSPLPSNTFNNAQNAAGAGLSSRTESVASGAILFTGNLCQLEATVSHQLEFSSVAIFTADHLIFSNNHCWLHAPRSSSILEALLVAFSLNVVGNRFQESPSSVLLSGLTAGTINITAENISTYCLIALGNMLSNNNNLALVSATNQEICAILQKDLQGAFNE
jgi:hypothetical protein